MGSLEKQGTWTRPVRWAKYNYKHVQWRMIAPEQVIAKGPEVTRDTVTQRQKTPKVQNASGLLADHAARSKTPRLGQAPRILAPRR